MLRLVMLLSLVACTRRNPAACCENAEECERLGTTEIVTCKVGVCVDFTCVDPGPCDGNEDCEAPQTCVEMQCTSPPPPIDAALVPAFDFVYPNEWRISVSGPGDASMVIANTSPSPLNVATLQVRSLSDDHPTAFVRLVASPSAASILPGFAGGEVVPIARPFIDPLVPEQRTDEQSSYISIELVDAPQGTYDIHASATLALDGVEIPLELTIHVVPGPTIFFDPEAATRISLFRS